MPCSGLSFVPNVSDLALHQWSYKVRRKRCNVCIQRERKKLSARAVHAASRKRQILSRADDWCQAEK